MGPTLLNSDAPNAYLGYIYMDRDFHPASIRLLSKSITTAAIETGVTANGSPHELLTLIDTVKEAGYVYLSLAKQLIQMRPRQIQPLHWWSTYQFAFNNPIRYNDPKGDRPPIIGNT